MIWKPRQRRYIEILKRRRMNTSLPQKYENGTIQMLDPYDMGGIPCLIESAYAYDGSVEYNVTTMYGEQAIPERMIRPMTFKEFAWFRHPKTGRMMMGSGLGWWSVLPATIILGTLWLGTYKNWNRSWV